MSKLMLADRCRKTSFDALIIIVSFHFSINYLSFSINFLNFNYA